LKAKSFKNLLFESERGIKKVKRKNVKSPRAENLMVGEIAVVKK